MGARGRWRVGRMIYECGACGKMFTKKSEIRRHYEGRVVNGEAPEKKCLPAIAKVAVMTRVSKNGVWQNKEWIYLHRMKPFRKP